MPSYLDFNTEVRWCSQYNPQINCAYMSTMNLTRRLLCSRNVTSIPDFLKVSSMLFGDDSIPIFSPSFFKPMSTSTSSSSGVL